MLDLYKNIRKRRKELKMTQTELAFKVGYTNKSSIASVESGKVNLPISKIKEFAAALETTASDLMGDVIYDDVPPMPDEVGELIDLYSRASEEVKTSVLTLLRSSVQK